KKLLAPLLLFQLWRCGFLVSCGESSLTFAIEAIGVAIILATIITFIGTSLSGICHMVLQDGVPDAGRMSMLLRKLLELELSGTSPASVAKLVTRNWIPIQ
ncbi:unnamed protein product, partial [Owenia fusiformis]